MPDSKILFVNIFAAEYYKLKRHHGKWLLLLFPAVTNLFVGAIIYKAYSDIIFNPWIILGQYSFYIFAMLYPVVIAFVVHSFQNMEYQNNTYKQLFTFPVSKLKLYLAKSLLYCCLFSISILIAFVCYFLVGNVLSIIRPDLSFQHYDIRPTLYVFFFKMFCALICISFIQSFLSFMFRSFVIPVSIAAFITCLCLIFTQWEHIDFIPYAIILLSAN
ncbi:MAG: ABC transporter permease, partial [Bacteroidales bacterium]|nr:ABC transporter permease [Bacteroidales bacterium]